MAAFNAVFRVKSNQICENQDTELSRLQVDFAEHPLPLPDVAPRGYKPKAQLNFAGL
jgi:hypothetical protein